MADDDTEQQRYVNVTIQYQLEDGTDVPNTMPTTFTVPVGKKVDWQPPQELHGYTFVKAEGMENAVPNSGMTIRYIYKRSEERPEPPVTKNYTVQYNWGSVFPTGATLPLNSSSYSSVQQAKAAVDKKYTSTTRIQAQKDGKNGTWAFSGWDAGNLNGTTVVFRGSWSFTADTAPITPPSGTASYKITATAGIGGTISPGGTTTVSAAGQLTYTIKANEGYYIADVKVDGSEVTATTSYTFSDVNTDHTIEVTFKQESQTPDNTYQIIDGANSSWTPDSDGNITIRGNGDFSKFTGVKVDGNLIDKSNYTAKEGSTIITLKASYLNTLSAGTHTVEILWTDGSASTTFTIKANTTDNKPSSGTDKKDDAPKTGDNTPSVWLFILSILSGTGLIITVKKRRENLNS